jgi:hypothetical protein
MKIWKLIFSWIWKMAVSGCIGVFMILGIYWFFIGQPKYEELHRSYWDYRINTPPQHIPDSLDEKLELVINNINTAMIADSVKNAAESQLLIDLQRRNRFSDIRPENRCWANDSDRLMRGEMLKDWTESFELLYTLIDWPLLDKLHDSYSHAKVISIMEADTLAYVSNIKPKRICILALRESEYTIPNGVNKDAAAYYSHDQNMIIFRHNYKYRWDYFSFYNARDVFHELCHHYLKKYGWTNAREHVWIKKKEAELLSKLSDYYCVSPDSAIILFNTLTQYDPTYIRE